MTESGRAIFALQIALGAAAGAVLGRSAAAESSPQATTPSATRPADLPYRWFSLPVDVSGLPAGAAFVPVTCPIDFSTTLAQLRVNGVADEHSIRLLRLGADGH